MKHLRLPGPGVAPLLLAVGLLLFGPTALRAQGTVVTAGPDSAAVVAGPAVPDSLRRTERLLGFRVTRPAKATYLALALPGAGQVYNHKYWKLPLVYGAVGGTVYGEIFYQRLYKEFSTGYQTRKLRVLSGDPTITDPGPRSGLYPNTSTGDAQQQAVFRRYRTQRDVFYAYIAVAYGMQVLDALVDANLHDFDVGEELSLRWHPALLPNGPLPAAGFALTFALHPAAPPAGPRR